MSAKLILA